MLIQAGGKVRRQTEEMDMRTRICAICAGFAIGILALFVGDLLHLWGAADAGAPVNQKTGAFILTAIVFIALAIDGGVSWVVVVSSYFDREDGAKDNESAFVAAMAFSSICAAFGILVAPFSAYETYPWASAWNIVLLFAAFPLLLVIRGIVADYRKGGFPA